MKLLLKSNDYYYFEGSDGVHFITVLLSKSNGRLDIFDLSDYDLIEFKDFKINSPIKQPDGSEFPLIQIKGDVKIVKKSNTKVGNPVRFTKNSIISHSLSYPAFNEEEIKKTTVVKQIPNEFTKVADLSSLMKEQNFKIKATICKKHPLKVHRNGQLFKVDLLCDLDKQTMIEGTFYTEESEHFENLVHQNKTYVISGVEISAANKKFTSIPHDYRLIFKLTSTVELVEQAGKQDQKLIERVNLINVNELLEGMDNPLYVELYGQVTCEVGRESITAFHSSKQYNGRTQLSIVDWTQAQRVLSPSKFGQGLQINLWGKFSELDINPGDMLLIIGGSCTNKFGNNQINLNPSHGKCIVNPSPQDYTIPCLDMILSPKNNNLQSVTSGKITCEKQEPVMALIQDLTQANAEKLAIFNTISQVTKIETPFEQILYKACTNCYTKIPPQKVSTITGLCMCDKCKKPVQVEPQYFLRVRLQDATGNIEVGFARKEAELLFIGVTPKEFYEKFKTQEDFDQFAQNNILLRDFKTTIKRKQEKFKDEIVDRFYAYRVELMSPEEASDALRGQNKRLVKSLSTLSGKSSA